MKISAKAFKELCAAIKENIEADEIQDDSFGDVRSYILDDLILSFKNDEKSSFMGLSFDALGQSLHIIPTGEVLIEGEEEEETVAVEDEEFLSLLNEFFLWRAKVVRAINI